MRNTLVMLLRHTLNIRGQIKALGFSSLPLGLLFFLATTAHAAPVILDVRDVDTPGADSVLHVGGLTDGVSGFVDRVGQDWINVPTSLEGADYIESAQNNADVSDDLGTSLLIEVDVAEGAVLYMFIDETQPNTPFPWMNLADFGADWVDTGLDIFWTFNGATFDIWRTVGPLAAGTYNFRQMPVPSSFYGIAATDGIAVPLPVILDVRDVDTPGADSVRHLRGLTDGVSGFVDRDNQNWINVPESLEGADYIESAQNNADVTDERGTSLLMEVDVAFGAVLYMFIDATQPVEPFPWMNFTNFGADWVDTGLNISWTFNDATFDIWRTVVPLDAGTYNFRQQPTDSSFYGIAATLATVPVDIDIKPGGDPNSINPNSDGVVPAAILTTDTFDAAQVDPLTVAFGPNGATESDGQSHIQDVDDDGDMDLVLHFNIQDTGIQCGDTEASLTGETFSGDAIEGTDTVKTAGCEEPARIAFGSNRDGNFKIFVMDADGSNQTPLTTNTGDEFWPDWSPDGRKIAFYSFIGDGNSEIYVVDSDGSNLTKLTNNPFRDETPVWSPDGNKIAFSTRRDGDWEVYVMDADGSNQTNLTMTLGVDVRPTCVSFPLSDTG